MLIANRHACCVCQKPHVQLHHIDDNPSHNDPANIACLCLNHHNMATMVVGLTKKLQPDAVRAYKAEWELHCSNDILALSRQRFTFYYCIYKNPQRIIGAFASLSEAERVSAAQSLRDRLLDEEPRKKEDSLFGFNAVPRVDEHTGQALDSIFKGEATPAYLKPADLKFEPDEPYRSPDHYMAYHKYDLWCQIAGQTLAEARGTIPLEDLFKFETAEEIDKFSGSLISYRLSVRGKGVRPPRFHKEVPTASLHAKKKAGETTYNVEMNIRTVEIFSDTSAMNLQRGRISGLAILAGAQGKANAININLAPLLIGTGGWNIYPKNY